MRSDEPATSRRRLRVALVGCSGLLGDIIEQTLIEHADVDIVGDFPAGRVPSAAEADLVVWNEASEADVAAWLLAAHRQPRVLTTIDDGRDASLWELTPHRTRLGSLSPSTLVEAITTDAAAGGERP